MSSILAKPEFPDPSAALEGRSGPGARSVLARLGAQMPVHLFERVKRAIHRPPPPLNLELTDRFVGFRSPREFDFALASRTEFPAAHVHGLMASSPAELEAAAARIRDAEHCLAQVLARSAREPALTGELFRELDPRLFSQDHGWREIMEGLVRLSPDFDAYRRVALVRYMQYLRARQTLLRSAFVEKTRDDDGACLHATPAMAGGWPGAEADTARARRRRDAPVEHDYRALPKGETVSVDPGDARHLELLLAGNRLRLYTGRECYLVDDGDNTYPLRPGKNLVGRQGSCDVVLDPACRAISRTHLIVEPLPGGRVLLTDLSSHGTEVAAALPTPG